MGDAFLLTCTNSDNMIKAAIHISKNWNKYIKINNLNNYIRLGIDRGHVKIYRSLAGGQVMNNAALLESFSKKLKNENKSIVAISKTMIKNVSSNIKTQFNKVPKNKLNPLVISRIEEVYILEI